jgi:hypothetical protein
MGLIWWVLRFSGRWMERLDRRGAFWEGEMKNENGKRWAGEVSRGV